MAGQHQASWPAPGRLLASAIPAHFPCTGLSGDGRENCCVLQEVGAEGLGAAHVDELTREDWESLPSWGALRPLEQRRLLGSRSAGSGAPAP